MTECLLSHISLHVNYQGVHWSYFYHHFAILEGNLSLSFLKYMSLVVPSAIWDK